MHARAHDASQRERRGNTLIVRGLSIASPILGLSGQCDVVEFRACEGGVPLQEENGRWQPYPIEYKRGEPKENDADALQLCAQAMCLEAALCCTISEGALFYGKTKRRMTVSLDDKLREKVRRMTAEMHELARRGHTPKVKPSKSCNACSLRELCLPALMRKKSVQDYLGEAMEGDE